MDRKNWHDDRRLDIVVLGPMGGENEKTPAPQCLQIKEALERVLSEERAKELLSKAQINNYLVHAPEQWGGADIIDGVFSRIDSADLVIISLTPRTGPDGQVSANVYYELGLVNSLGIPHILLVQKGTKVPFYLKNFRYQEVENNDIQHLAQQLSQSLYTFLDLDSRENLGASPVSRFYDGLPVVDISAAVGLGTGYYTNFIERFLKEGGYRNEYPELVRGLIMARPQSLDHSYNTDKQHLTQVLEQAGMTLKTEQLPQPKENPRGPVWIDHVDGIIIDLPRTMYTLKHSPRFMTLTRRLYPRDPSGHAHPQAQHLLKQMSQRLIEQMESGVRYLMRQRLHGVEPHRFAISTIDELPQSIQQLRQHLGLN